MNILSALARFLAPVLLCAASVHASLALAQSVSAVGPVFSTEQVRAELMAHAPDGVAPGKTVWLGLQLTHQSEWHTYWKNAGDSGLPTVLDWNLPKGVSAGAIDWPTPIKIRVGTLANYGYEGSVLLPVPLTISAEFEPASTDALEIGLMATWLVCKIECIPQDGTFRLSIPTRGSTAANGAAFAATFAAVPRALPTAPASGITLIGQALKLTVHGLPAPWHGKTLELFPESPEVIEPAAQWSQRWDGDAWSAEVPLAAQRANSPAMMPLVLALGDNSLRVELDVVGQWPAATGAAPVSTALQQALASTGSGTAPSAPLLGFWAALFGALLGGLILNLMPCVFPILAIKVLGFARHAGDRRAHRINGLAYTAGVLTSFVALGMLMLALRSAGESLGWGFQLQNPAVVAALAILFTLIGLNLAGVFQFAHMLPSRLASFQPRHPVVDAFLTGVLAVAIASPCSAPFMGASIGVAVSLPPAQAMAVFAMLGLGLALPYLVASQIPAVARMLPKPGAWMDRLRKFMAFPMFGTVVWLLWVLGQQSGIDGASALLALLVALAFALWSLSLAGRARALLGGVALLVLATLSWGIGPTVTQPMARGQQSVESGWEAWEPGRVDQILASGRPVFVDFTAAWCVTCQYNKKTTLSDPDLLADMAERKVVRLRADWTRRDPAITAALQQLGRSGVPVYVLYQNGRAPQLLSEILTVGEVRAALARL